MQEVKRSVNINETLSGWLVNYNIGIDPSKESEFRYVHKNYSEHYEDLAEACDAIQAFYVDEIGE